MHIFASFCKTLYHDRTTGDLPKEKLVKAEKTLVTITVALSNLNLLTLLRARVSANS